VKKLLGESKKSKRSMSEGQVSGKGQEMPHRGVIEPMRSSWFTRREDKARRLEQVAKVAHDPAETAFLETPLADLLRTP
jgi:hypothetical protein